MTNVLIGTTFVMVAVTMMVWRTFHRARVIASAPDRAPMAPENAALAISSGAGDLREISLRANGSTAEYRSGGGGGARGADGEPCLTRARISLLATLALSLAGCATAPAGSIPRVIDVTNTSRQPEVQPSSPGDRCRAGWNPGVLCPE